MTAPRRDHPWRWPSPREAQPVGREIERRDDPAEDVERGTTSAVPTRTATRATADHPTRTVSQDAAEAGRRALNCRKIRQDEFTYRTNVLSCPEIPDNWMMPVMMPVPGRCLDRMCHQDAQQRAREKSQDHGLSWDFWISSKSWLRSSKGLPIDDPHTPRRSAVPI
jgi:hypothetical protein